MEEFNLLSFEEMIPDPYHPDWERLSTIDNEGAFTSNALELLKESSIYLSLVANSVAVTPSSEQVGWTRNEAIVNGLLIRSTRLLSGYFSEITSQHMDVALLIQRSIVESLVNAQFLLKKNSSLVFDAYVEYSLRHEKQILLKIEEAVVSRGYRIPIENRMMESIERAFDISGVSVDSVDETGTRPWAGSIYKRFESIGLKGLYFVAFGGMSHQVHGNWQDLVFNDLEKRNGRFLPSGNRLSPRPQPIEGLAIVVQRTIATFMSGETKNSHQSAQVLIRVGELEAATRRSMELHERYLSRVRT